MDNYNINEDPIEQTNLADFTADEETLETDWDNLEFEEINPEVKNDVEKWIPENPNDFIIGRYLTTEEGKGRGEGLLFHILEDREGKKHSILGNDVINDNFRKIEYGKIVKIIYKGTVISKRGREYKNYKFHVAKGN